MNRCTYVEMLLCYLPGMGELKEECWSGTQEDVWLRLNVEADRPPSGIGVISLGRCIMSHIRHFVPFGKLALPVG